MKTTSENQILSVPGARLCYEVRGSGPLLLLISGGEGGSEGYDNLADHLGGDYTVITYDRRGARRSPVDDPGGEVSLEMHSDDAHRLLSALTAEPAYVFGNSAGALVGLDLAIRYPGQVRTLVAHEPPVEGVLPELDRFQEEILQTYRTQGPAAALLRFMRQLGVTYDELEPGVELPARDTQDFAARGQTLITFTFRAVHGYRLDLEAVAAAPTRIVLAGGSAGKEFLTYRNTAALAQRLRMPLVDFPGHHAGYVNRPGAFAGALRAALTSATGDPVRTNNVA